MNEIMATMIYQTLASIAPYIAGAVFTLASLILFYVKFRDLF